MRSKQCHKPPLWEWFIEPISGDLGGWKPINYNPNHLNNIKSPPFWIVLTTLITPVWGRELIQVIVLAP